jgi:hypothetical protein
MHHTEQVDVHDTPKIFDVSIAQLAHDCDCGVVEHVIQTPVSRDDGSHQSLGVRGLRHVRLHRFRATASSLNRSRHLTSASHVNIRHKDVRFRSRELIAQRAPNTRGAARYDSCAICEPGHWVLNNALILLHTVSFILMTAARGVEAFREFLGCVNAEFTAPVIHAHESVVTHK